MTESEKTVFISYRRRTSKHLAGRICDSLRSHGYDVFLDVDTINSGKFDSIILKQIAGRIHFIVILTPRTLVRCANPDDWLRREIEEAIRLERNIVPIVEEGFRESEYKHLPEELRNEFKRYNTLPLYSVYFEAAMDRLRNRYLQQPAYNVVITPSQTSGRVNVEMSVPTASSQPSKKHQLSAQAFFSRAHAKQKKSDLEGAIADYTEAIRVNPQYGEAYSNRAVARKDSGDLDGAIADCTDAIGLRPQDGDPFTNRGVARYDKGDLDGAIADYTSALSLNSQDAKAYNNRGNARFDKGDVDGAIADYTEAIRFNPQDPNAFNGRGVALKSKGDLEGAIADYTDAIRCNPEYAGAYNNRGNASVDQGNFESAIADYTTYLELGGGKKYGNQKKVEQIIRELKKRMK